MMRVVGLAVLAVLVSPALAPAAGAAEMYAISRNVDGSFHSSHRLYDTRGLENLHEVTLCGRPYYMRTATVAWMAYETEEGRSVGLEFNQGRGWVQACENPANQVTLADLGVPGENYEVMRATDVALARRERFKHISRAFAGYRNSGETTASFHGR